MCVSQCPIVSKADNNGSAVLFSCGKCTFVLKELVDKIEPEKDGIIIYKFSGYGLPDKDILGKTKGENRFIL